MQSDGKDFASMIDSFVEWVAEHGRVMLYSFLAGVILMLVFGCSAANAYTKPQGAPEIVVPGRNVTVAIWADQTAVGHGIGIFELRAGTWYLCGTCLIDVEYPTLDNAVNGAGGALPYVASKVPAINAKLAALYPASNAPPTGSAIDRVNQALGSFALGLVNGSPVLAPR
jgi:hypothetical protein